MVALRMFGAVRSAAAPLKIFKANGGVRMLSGVRFNQYQTNREPTRNGFRGCILKQDSRLMSSYSSGGSSKGKGLLYAIGAATVGVGALAYAYLETEEGRKYGDHAYTAHCAQKGGDDCVERKCGDSDCLHKMDREEEMIAKANNELEKALRDVKPKAVEYSESALRAYCEATDLVKQFMDKVYCAIEEDNLDSPRFEEVWCDIYDTAQKRCEKVKEALNKGQCAWELLCRLREVIENGKACKYTSCNPLLITAEESLMCAERELLNAKAKMECIQSESRLVEQYRNVVEDFRRDLKAEVDSMLTSDDCKANLTGNETTMIITHAYKKVLRIQKELAQVQTLQCFGDLDKTEAYQRLLNNKANDALRKDFERDIIEALKRQALAYQENFDNQLKVLKAEYQRRIEQQDKIYESERVVELRAKYNQASAALAAIEQGIEARQEMNFKSRNMRKLWAVCNTLFSKINYAQYYVDSSNPTYTYSPVNKEELSKEFEGDAFAKQLISTLPNKVSSCEDLKQRFFQKLEPTCRKTMILKEGEKLSLWKYALGSLESFLIARCDGERETFIKTYEILDKAGFHLKRGDLLEATVALNKLTGMPREVARDWLADARAVLETNQTLFTLMTYAASNNVY